MSTYVDLHLHTEYSLLDGASRIKDVMKRAKELGMEAVGITDHGVMHGALEFYRAAVNAGIKPVIGTEAYIAPRTMADRDKRLDRERFHLLMLAQNMTGYKNLIRMSSKAQLEGYYYKPRMDKNLIAENSDGIIVTSGCLAAEIPRLVERGLEDQAEELIGWYYDVFGADNFYLEVQPHKIDELKVLNKWLISYRSRNHTPVQLIAANDTHYVLETDQDPHDTLLCIQIKGYKSQGPEDRMMLTPKGSYFMRSEDQMRNALIGSGLQSEFVDEAIGNTRKVAEMTDVNLEVDGYHLPNFPVPDGHDATSYLRYLSEVGLEWRYGDDANRAAYRERLDHELGIIQAMGFETYFLVVWDLCEFARYADIWWNVRGSGAGSIVTYALGITNVDPIKNGLIFERFLNPERTTMPDIDLDYPDDRRAELIAYAAEKYGKDNVAAIITFGKMKQKAAVRDIGRVMAVDQGTVNKLASLMPEGKPKPLEVYFELEPEMRQMYETDDQVRYLLDTLENLQGITRLVGTHAAGVIISDKPLEEYLPLHRIIGTDPSRGSLERVTQFPMEESESIGLLKVDFLGLSTLTILRLATDLIRRYHGVDYDIDNIPYDHDDPRLDDGQLEMLDQAFDMMGRGETVGVFQVESPGMQSMLQGMKPYRYQHIIAGVALYRPGPMELIPSYNARMRGDEPIEYLHDKLENVLDDTYGIIVFQEQILQIAVDLFGYTGGEADLMRRAISKKKLDQLEAHRATFIKEGPERGIDAKTANDIFDLIVEFADYGFNRCVIGSTEVVDTNTGEVITVEEIHEGSREVSVLSLDESSGKLVSQRVKASHKNGVKPVYRLVTNSGRNITATGNHPFRTYEGWTNLEDLSEGDLIATPRTLPVKGDFLGWSDEMVISLGHLIAEGNLCHPAGAYFYSGDDLCIKDFELSIQGFDNVVPRTGEHRNLPYVYTKRKDPSKPNALVEWLKSIGIWGKRAVEKFIPDQAFRLNENQTAMLIGRMWSGDGHVGVKRKEAYYATSSRKLAYDVQHLLLKLGILSSVKEKVFKYKDGRVGYQVWIWDTDSLILFVEKIGKHIVGVKSDACLSIVQSFPINGRRTKFLDRIPIGVRDTVRNAKNESGLTWDGLAKLAETSTSSFAGAKPHDSYSRKGYSRETIQMISDALSNDSLRSIAHSDIYWDEVIAIEYVGEEMTYDLEMPTYHNFVANNIIVHNSHATDYGVLTVMSAFLKCHYPHEYIAALLSISLSNADKVAKFIVEARRLGIPVLPPDVNSSEVQFTIEEENGVRSIRIGLGAVRDVATASIERIVEERHKGGAFRDINDFAKRFDVRGEIGSKSLDALLKVGAFNSMDHEGNPNHDQDTLLFNIEEIVGYSKSKSVAGSTGQLSFLDFAGISEIDQINLHPSPHKMSHTERLRMEKTYLGIYLSGRPTDEYAEMLSFQGTTAISEINALNIEEEERADEFVTIAGEVSEFKPHTAKTGNKMAFMAVDCWHPDGDRISIVVFPSIYESMTNPPVDSYGNPTGDPPLGNTVFVEGALVIMDAKINYYGGKVSLQAVDIRPLKPVEKFDFDDGTWA